MIDSAALGATAYTSMSMWSLFLQADMIVKTVMIALILASIWSWAIIFEKHALFGRIRRRVKKFEEKFWKGGSLDELFDKIGSRPQDPMSAIFVSAMKEWRRSAVKISSSEKQSIGGASLQQRVERSMQITLDREVERIEQRMTFLASTGSVSPFVGLFGTVWGIMNSFHAIGLSNDTSLAVVAPGIAEALFATALGLVAAIPAVVAYNKISSDIDRFAQRLENFAGEFGSILSRQLDDAVGKESGDEK